ARSPSRRERRIGKKILSVLSSEIRDLTDLTRSDDFSGELRSWRADVVEAHHVGASRAFRLCSHFSALLDAFAKRLLAEHRFSQRECGQCDAAMGSLWARDHDRLNFGGFDETSPI